MLQMLTPEQSLCSWVFGEETQEKNLPGCFWLIWGEQEMQQRWIIACNPQPYLSSRGLAWGPAELNGSCSPAQQLLGAHPDCRYNELEGKDFKDYGITCTQTKQKTNKHSPSQSEVLMMFPFTLGLNKTTDLGSHTLISQRISKKETKYCLAQSRGCSVPSYSLPKAIIEMMNRTTYPFPTSNLLTEKNKTCFEELNTSPTCTRHASSKWMHQFY